MLETGGMGIARSVGTGSRPVWQGTNKDIQLAQGGFLLVTTGLAVGDVLLAGTPLVFDEAARTATVLHTGFAYANAGGSATDYQVVKGNSLKVGDNLASGATGGKAYPITAIDRTTSTSYDTVTVGTSIGAVTAGDTLYASTATGATASALPAANGLLYEETQVFPTGLKNSVSAVIRGTVYARRVPYSAAIAALTGLRFIIYSQSR
jgi:hypothetical protein